MWSGTLGGAGSLEERAEATRAAGYELLTVGGLEALAWTDAAASRRALTDRGIRVHSLDAVVSWTGIAATTGDGERLLDAAAGLGAPAVTVVSGDPPGTGRGALLPGFARFCAAAADRGLLVDLEFVPMSAVPDVAAATELLDDLGRPDVGLVFDTWHFCRGVPDLAAAVRAAPRIRQVQISDAAREVRGGLFRDTMQHRRLPGAGDLPLEPVLRVLHEHGALRGVGPEVLSTELHARGPAAAARAAAAAVDALLARVLRPPGPVS